MHCCVESGNQGRKAETTPAKKKLLQCVLLGYTKHKGCDYNIDVGWSILTFWLDRSRVKTPMAQKRIKLYVIVICFALFQISTDRVFESICTSWVTSTTNWFESRRKNQELWINNTRSVQPAAKYSLAVVKAHPCRSIQTKHSTPRKENSEPLLNFGFAWLSSQCSSTRAKKSHRRSAAVSSENHQGSCCCPPNVPFAWRLPPFVCPEAPGVPSIELPACP